MLMLMEDAKYISLTIPNYRIEHGFSNKIGPGTGDAVVFLWKTGKTLKLRQGVWVWLWEQDYPNSPNALQI